MLRPSTLIHLLVSLALILNGFGAAAASATMASARVSDEAVVATSASHSDHRMAATHSGCHEHQAIATHAEAVGINTGSPEGEGDPSDCCKDGTCSCGCVHQSQVVLVAAEFLVMPAIAPTSMQWERLVAPLSPSLSKPARPPIA